jgi:hypothetical protein
MTTSLGHMLEVVFSFFPGSNLALVNRDYRFVALIEKKFPVVECISESEGSTKKSPSFMRFARSLLHRKIMEPNGAPVDDARGVTPPRATICARCHPHWPELRKIPSVR